MKKLLLVLFFVSPLQAKTIVLNIPDNDIKVVENDVIDGEQWIKDAWAGKFNKCKERLVKQEVDRSIQEGSQIPSTADAIVQKAFLRPDYKNRRDRDAQGRNP